MVRTFLFLTISALMMLTAFGCDPCRKLAKGKSVAERDSAAFCYFKRKHYQSATDMFQQLKDVYRGLPQMERTMYYYAYSKYYTKDVLLAAFYFSEFVQQYPASKYSEEATYMTGHCYYQMSNAYELDQRETLKAIDYFQLYLQHYPLGRFADESQKNITELRNKLALKAYEQARLYYKTYHYNSAIVAFKNFLAAYPDAKYREISQFELYRCAVLYAQHSVPEKQQERYELSVEYYLKFIDKFPNSAHRREAETLYQRTLAALEKIKRGEKLNRNNEVLRDKDEPDAPEIERDKRKAPKRVGE